MDDVQRIHPTLDLFQYLGSTSPSCSLSGRTINVIVKTFKMDDPSHKARVRQEFIWGRFIRILSNRFYIKRLSINDKPPFPSP